ncbi:DUF3667 domain-containing protein [Luteimonas sp. 50]|uniref:DUF3667 domain-containing protein n=1 Tax=Cognatiluteimonas sedimenti TaxID=2927791 RepID=A0ABT0A667_9GAMM|nr:DUF3667 domain-containing protein [Lysobacter sedimenti]MCJ0826467.1 DUF3667 domain-containing protein [Lysobacter sedimenti]
MTEPAGTPATTAAPAPACQNCGTPLLGPHCYACGQPVNGLVRHFSSIIGDFLDSVLNIDARVLRTLWPLFARPGYLSREYFAGRRVRYVSPVRLFVFLSIVTFFVAQLMLSFGPDAIQFDNGDSFQQATTVAEVERARDQALKGLEQARAEIPGNVPGARVGIDAGAAAVRDKARKRIAELQARTDGGPPPRPAGDAADADATPDLQFNGRPWDPVANPVRVRWLPGFANRWINQQVGKGRDNVAALRKDPNRLKDAVLGALPSTLFVLLPIFALMLKLAYLFKRRLYMEHLIVALHSHAFLCLALLLVFGFSALGRAAPAAAGFARAGEGLLFAWMPLYLLLMQKRVYAQGWIMTVLKYFVLGVCYLVLLSLGVAFTVLASLVWA